VPFGIWLLLREPRRAFALVLWAALAFAPWAWMYRATSGQLFGPAMGQTAQQNWEPLGKAHWSDVLLSPGRGILVYQPWLLLGAAGYVAFSRRIALATERAPCPAGWQVFCVCAIVIHLALVCVWRCWWGGYCWGSRLSAEIIPLAGLLCLQPVAMLWRTRSGPALVFGVVVLSYLMHIPGVYLRGATWYAHADSVRNPKVLWSWSDAPFLYPLRQPRTASR
jgi:hypothetical protein